MYVYICNTAKGQLIACAQFWHRKSSLRCVCVQAIYLLRMHTSEVCAFSTDSHPQTSMYILTHRHANFRAEQGF